MHCAKQNKFDLYGHQLFYRHPGFKLYGNVIQKHNIKILETYATLLKKRRLSCVAQWMESDKNRARICKRLRSPGIDSLQE
jgi:hypothetical protein